MTGDRRSMLLAICAGGALLRIVTTYLLPNIAHPDETFQYLEQAYRLSTGHGLVPWEYAVGARSWILPGLITPSMKLGLALSSSPAVHLWAVTLLMIALATAGVAAAFVLGERAGGLAHGCLAGLLAAVWCELVYLSPHVLADTMAAVPLISALAVAYKVESASARRMVWAGTLFGLAFVFRIQLAPAIAVAMLAICGRDIRFRYVSMGLGFLGPVLLMGLTDWVTLGAPFRSVLVYIMVNASGVADTFGTTPALGYVVTEASLWGLATPLVLITAWFGARKLPLVAVVTGLILLTFSLIGHKEYRFVYPALPLLFVLSGVGTADLVEWIAMGRVRFVSRLSPTACLAAASLLWIGVSAAAGMGLPMQAKWHQEVGWLDGFRRLDADPDACGLGIDPPDVWFLTGRVRLRANVGLYDGASQAGLPAAAAYNYLFVFEPKDIAARQIGDFRQLACGGWTQKVCVYKRSGGCNAAQGHILEADPGPEVKNVLRRIGLAR